MGFLNLRDSCTLLVCVSSPWLNNYSFFYHLKANMWSSWIGGKGNLCHVFCKAKGWFQKSQKKLKQFRRRVKMERKIEN
jgi:hypothetical protein